MTDVSRARRRVSLMLLQPGDHPDPMLQRPSQAVQLPDDEGVPRADEVEGLLEAPALGLGAAGRDGEDPLAAGLPEGIPLERGGLLLGGDAGIADEHAAIVSQLILVNRM